MTAYATYSDVQARMERTLSSSEQAICTTLLDDAALIIDTYNSNASPDAKKVVSCRMVIRAISVTDADTPLGSAQGSLSANGYSQSWTMGSGGTVGELYLSKLDKQLLGGSKGNAIGTYSPIEELVSYDEEF